MPTKDEMLLAARLVHAGIIDKDQAEAVLRERDAVREQIAAPTILDLLVKQGLLTRTELCVFRDRPLEEIQPFPKYTIHGKIAEGGMSQVYRATYKPLDVQVALKVMKPELSREARFLLRFRREAGILLKLEHEHIVRGYDLAEQERVWYCAMEFAEGRDLETLVSEDGPFSEGEAMLAVAPIVEALIYLDSRGIVHRDIKPSNVVMDEAGGSRIIDLGLSLLRGGMKDDGLAGMTVGTVEYMAPEQARAREDIDGRADLYAVGASLHHLVTGEVPFKGASDEETLAKQVLATFRPDRLVAAGMSDAFVDLVVRLLAKEPEGRPESAVALLEEMTQGWPVLAPPAPAPVPLPAEPVPVADVAPDAPADSAPILPKLVPKKDRSKDDSPSGGRRRRTRRRR